MVPKRTTPPPAGVAAAGADAAPTWKAIAAILTDAAQLHLRTSVRPGVEFEVYRLATEGGTFGYPPQSADRATEHLAVLRALSAQLESWVTWDETVREDDIQGWTWTAPMRPVSLAEWAPMYAAYKTRYDEDEAALAALQASCAHEAPWDPGRPSWARTLRWCSICRLPEDVWAEAFYEAARQELARAPESASS